MCVDRIIAVEVNAFDDAWAVITEHDIFPDDWYLDAAYANCIAWNRDRRFIFIGYLGLFYHQSLAVYRFVEAEVTFHGICRAGNFAAL
jgi:hypothetical protein